MAHADLLARARWFGGWLSVLADRFEEQEREVSRLRARWQTEDSELATVQDERDELKAELAKRNAGIESDRKCAEELHRHCEKITAERDAALAELEVTREALRWARSTAAVVDDVLRSRDRLGTKLGALRGKYRDALAATRQLMEEHARCATGPAAQRIAELEEQVKRVTSTGVDILINRNALAARIIGWACALCGDRERTGEQAIADVDAELARLAEQRDATGEALVTVTRERDEARRQVDRARAAFSVSDHPRREVTS